MENKKNTTRKNQNLISSIDNFCDERIRKKLVVK